VPTAEKNELTLLVLSAVGSVTAKAFGIAFDLVEELRPIYSRFGHALPDKNGDDSRVLPIPETYMINRGRTVGWPSSTLTIVVAWRPWRFSSPYSGSLKNI
jgi:hypothetical protein